MTLDSALEAVLFVAGGPLTKRRLTEITERSLEDVESSLTILRRRLDEAGGLMLVEREDDFELVTHPDMKDMVHKVTKSETDAILSRASLEALAILAYRGPLTRPEIEQIRGVQSTIILRHLMIRGLVERKEEVRLGQPIYQITVDFLKHLGLASVKDLPEYSSLHAHASVEAVLDDLEKNASRF